MAARSAARAMRPSNASTSRTRWPLPRPPIAGLHDIAPIWAREKESKATEAPMRAAAAAASQPAWPPPTTMMSKPVMRSHLVAGRRLFHVEHLFSDAEAAEQCVEHVIHSRSAGDAVERATGRSQRLRLQEEVVRVLRERLAGGGDGAAVAGVEGHLSLARQQGPSTADEERDQAVHSFAG